MFSSMDLRGRKVLFICAHTDDEMICAGTLYRLRKLGATIHVIACAIAATQQDRSGQQESIDIVLPEWRASMDIIGVIPQNREFLWMTPSSSLPRYNQDICQFIFDYCEMHKPDVVFTLSPEDENTAHSVVGVESERVMRGRVPIVIRCLFPWNYGIGRPNLFVSLTEEEMDVKRQVIECYKSQEFRYHYKEMLVNYCKADGRSVKREAAEKFEIIRAVV